MIDAHHHLWDLGTVHYPWLMAQGVERFFGDPSSIQRDYLLDEFQSEARECGISASVHIQVGAEDGIAEARWVQSIADVNPDWPMKQVVFCDLTAPDLQEKLDLFQSLPTVSGVRQIVGRAPGEDAVTGTNELLSNPKFTEGLRQVGERNLSFDLQLIPELMEETADVLARAPETRIALCHGGSPHDRSPCGLTYWSKKLSLLAEQPQVFCKLSGLGMFDHNWTAHSIKDIVAVSLEKFGPSRIMFGSNFPVDKLYSDYETLFSAYKTLVPQKDHAAVFCSTAASFYGFNI